MRLAPGTRLGPFEIVTPLGAGGMGEVYRARDTRLGRDIALKVLPEELAQSPDRMARFEREARTVAGLAHPNIVALFSIEEHGGTRFLVLELVEGRNLAEQLAPGGLPVDRVLELAIPIADALGAAHERGVVHRDLKPANVMLSRDGRVKVLDFGLAKSLQAADVHATEVATMDAPISGVGQVLGTLPYMAPEQVRGESADTRTDVFAFGVLLYELATGQRPFNGATTADLTSAILRDVPTPLTRVRAGLPPELERIVERCLAKNPRERYQTGLDVLNELKGMGRARTAPPAAHKAASVAVLPFANRSASAEDEYFAEGLADELLAVLARIRGLRVAARTSSSRFKGTNEDLAAIGRALNVETILEGSVRKAGNRVRISVQLVQVADGDRVWSESYDRTLDDVFSVQDEIAQAVVKELRMALLGEAGDSDASREVRLEVAHAAKGRTTDPEALRLMLQARHLIERRTEGDLDRGIGYLEQAVDQDPAFVKAWILLSTAYSWRSDNRPATRLSDIARSRSTLERALDLEPDNAEALAQKAWVRFAIDLDWKGANESSRRALALEPRNPLVLRIAGVIARSAGRYDEAIALFRSALEQDPLSALTYCNLGHTLGLTDRPAEGLAPLEKSLELAPGAYATHALYALTLTTVGRFSEAYEQARLEPDEVFRDYALSVLAVLVGRPEEGDPQLENLKTHHAADAASQIAGIYAARGDLDAAFAWIDRAIAGADGGVMEVGARSWFRYLEGDPRLSAVLKRLNFEEA